MKIITQLSLFDDTQKENLGDLERLKLVLENIPDAPLIQKLKSIRGKGRNEWPAEAMWNSFIASFIFDHDYKKGLINFRSATTIITTSCIGVDIDKDYA